ncbi:MAG TPA: hypothetical protein VG538_18220 [Vicinamibacterales bacterium]|nr:hypothetical protein [Vicinamibacterales bacterium]
MRTKDGRQRQELQAWLTRLVDALQGRIHGFNVSVAHVWAEQERLLEKAGQRMPRRIVNAPTAAAALLACRRCRGCCVPARPSRRAHRSRLDPPR